MQNKNRFYLPILFVLIASLALTGCAQILQPVTGPAASPTPIVVVEPGGVDVPDVYVDPQSFRPALVKALAERDTARLQMWMSEPFLTGGWTADMSDTPPADAMNELMTEQLGPGSQPALVEGVDLKALLGVDPLSIPREEAGVVDAFLVSGWGKDGRDEAVLFIARQADDSIKWHGWMRIKGGFSGARLGGNQFYQNDAHGYSLYLPKGYEISSANAQETMLLGPGAGHPSEGRVGIFIFAEPAAGRTAEQAATQIAEDNKAVMGPGYTGGEITVLGMGGGAAYSVGGLTGQDINRRVYLLHNDTLYTLMFVPDNPQAEAYRQMEDAYAMITNTFRFTK